MTIGRMRHRVTLQTETRTADGGGGATIAWTDQATVWAEITPLSGSEQLRGMALEGRVTHRIRIRYRSDIAPTAAWRVAYGARLFNVRAVLNENERNRFLILLADEGVAV